ncbi:MFS transporter [Micromonospora arborensis]|uniref:MFS transporter n=1 Tax=Micromonospora arborensis TaxID=2116518 RepID=UPI0033D7355B
MTASLTHPTTTHATSPGARGLRLGGLYGPAVFGVTAAAVALPEAAAALGVTPAAAVWVLTAHALALGVGTALAGRLSDALGLRTTLLTGALLLLLGTAVCLSASNLAALVAGRLILAAGSGTMTCGALSLAASTEPAERPGVLARLGAAMSAFSATATLAGGVVTAATSWRLTMVLPALSLLSLPLCLRMAGPAAAPGKRVDAGGAALLATAATALVVLIQSPALGLSTASGVAAGAVLVAATAALIARIRHLPDGFVPRTLVTDRVFVQAAVIGAGVYGGLFAVMFAAPLVLVSSHGWSVLAVGVALLPGAVLGAIASRAAGPLANTGRGHGFLAFVAATFSLTLVAASVTGGEPVALIAAASLGFAAFAVAQVVLTTQMSARIPATARGGALGLLNLAFFIGGAVGSAAAGALSPSMGPAGAMAVVAVLPLATAVLALRGRARGTS